MSGQTMSGQVKSVQVKSGQVKSGLFKSRKGKTGQVKLEMHLRLEFDSCVGPTCLFWIFKLKPSLVVFSQLLERALRKFVKTKYQHSEEKKTIISKLSIRIKVKYMIT